MIAAVTSSLTTVVEWIGTVLTAITSENGALAPVFPLLCVGISVSIVMLVVKVVKRFAWGA